MTDDVNPTARWLTHGLWKLLATVVLALLVLWLIGLAVDALFGLPDETSRVFPG